MRISEGQGHAGGSKVAADRVGPDWTTCSKCGVRLKHLKRHLRKKHPGRASPKRGRRSDQRSGKAKLRPFGPTFVSCDFCDVTIAARGYRAHVQRAHPGLPVRYRPDLAEGIQLRGLSPSLKDAIGRLRVPRYQQRYRPRLRLVQGGAPGLGRRGR
jgi:hypothetical protein